MKRRQRRTAARAADAAPKEDGASGEAERLVARATAAMGAGRLAEAVAALERLVRVRPDFAAAHSDLGTLLGRLGRGEDAVAAFRRAVALDPGFARAWSNLGNILKDLGQGAEAVAAHRRAVALEPGLAEAWSNLGAALKGQGDLDEAVAAYRQALALRPGLADAWTNLGNALLAQGATDGAIDAQRKAIALRPDYAEAHNNLGAALLAARDNEGAAAAFAEAVRLSPGHAEALSSLGDALRRLGRAAEAAGACQQAVALSPGVAHAHFRLGLALKECGRIAEAIAAMRRAIAIDPQDPNFHNDLALLLLFDGQYPEGWREHEWRFRAELAPRDFPQPRWRGEDLAGRRLLIWGEQGVGDEMVNFGVLPELVTRGASCIVECDARLVPLIRRSLPEVEPVPRSQPTDPRCLADTIDFQAPAVSALALLRPQLDGFAPIPPYLRADEAVTARLRQAYGGGGDRPLVGISWFTRHPEIGTKVSLPLSRWLPILKVPGMRFVSLQYGDHRAEIDEISAQAGVPVIHDDSVDPLIDIDRFLAQVAAMDLVISVDNSTITAAAIQHLPAWNLLAAIPDWRWLQDRDDTPWFPTMRLFRQPSPGDWDMVVARVAAELACWQPPGRAAPPAASADRLAAVAMDMVRAGRLDEAVSACRGIVALTPDVAAAWSDLGVLLMRTGRLDEAVGCLRRAVERQPGFAQAWSNLGNALKDLGRLDEAVAAHRRAVAEDPALAEAWANLGTALKASGLYAEAVAAYRHALALKPEFAQAWSNLGNALAASGEAGAAMAAHRKAIALAPAYAEAHSGLGCVLVAEGRVDEGIAAFRHAAALVPDFAEARNNLGHALLLQGRYPEGWVELEWRFRAGTAPRSFPQPRWQGADPRGLRLLVWGEQGVGDEFTYFAFLPELLARGASLVVECDPRLVPLIRRSLPDVEAVARQDPPNSRLLADDIDAQVPMVTAAGLLRPSLAGFRPLAPYLRPDPDSVAELRDRYAGGGLIVGISWQTRHQGLSGRYSVALADWLPILRVPGVRFVSLQYGDHRAEIAAVRTAGGIDLILDDGVDPLKDLDRFAAQVAAMDLVISIDNSTIEAATALGVPTWALIAAVPQWKMGLDGETTPWYPAMRLFRQNRRDGWAAVVAAVAETLRGRGADGGADAAVSQAMNHHRAGRGEEAVAAMRRAVSLRPGAAGLRTDLGAMLMGLGRGAEAMACYRRALDLDPGLAQAHANLGVALQAQGRLEDAVAAYRRAIAIKPESAAALANLGNALAKLGRHGDAEAAARAAIVLRPDHAAPHTSLGLALQGSDRPAEAAESYRRAIALAPGDPQAHANLAAALVAMDAPEEAVAACRQAIALAPEHAGAHANLGLALRCLGRLDEAVAACRRAIALAPDRAEAHNNLGFAFKALGRLDEALSAYRQAVALAPDHADYHNNLGLTLLLAGDYAEGWREHAWRFGATVPGRVFPQPQWRGEPLIGRRLLVWGEQGIGDEFAYFGLLPELAALAASCVVECDRRLVPLLERSLPEVEAVARRDPPDSRCLDAELQVPAETMAAILRPSLAGFVPLAPYLRADCRVTADLRHRYGDAVPRVGISWWTRHAGLRDRYAAPLAAWAPIFAVPGIRFVSLQYGDHRAEIAEARAAGIDLILDDDVDPLKDLDRFAAQIAAMDLVVSIDNSTIEVASALGVPCWTLLAHAPQWKMGFSGDATPWYPGMRLFRQGSADAGWSDVVARVAGELRRWMVSRSAGAEPVS